MRLIPLLLVAVLAATACRRSVTIHGSGTLSTAAPTLVAGTFITAAGTYSHVDGAVTRELTVSIHGNSVSWNLRRTERRGGGFSSGSNGSSLNLAIPADPWFIYVESPRRLWFFDGTKKLNYAMEDAAGARSSGPAIDGKIRPGSPVIPAELAERLPDDLRKLVQPAGEPASRPSF